MPKILHLTDSQNFKNAIKLSLGILVCLDCVLIESLDLDTFKKLVLSRSLNFVSTPPSSPNSLNRDREICQDLKFLVNLDSLSQSQSRVS